MEKNDYVVFVVGNKIGVGSIDCIGTEDGSTIIEGKRVPSEQVFKDPRMAVKFLRSKKTRVEIKNMAKDIKQNNLFIDTMV